MLPYFALTRSASDAERFAACLLYPFVCSFDILLAVVLSLTMQLLIQKIVKASSHLSLSAM